MGGLKKSLFLGYSQSSVHEVVNELKSQVNELEIRNSQFLKPLRNLKIKNCLFRRLLLRLNVYLLI